MIKGLPLEVLGSISPLLCWVEGGERNGLPANWGARHTSIEERAEGWLRRELPTYSQDNVSEILMAALDQGERRTTSPAKNLFRHSRKLNVSPPIGYDLVFAFDHLASYYLKWSGMEVCVNKGLMVELHELALRFPVQHLIRFFHAKAVAKGFLSEMQALQCPSRLSELHTNYNSLRTLVEQDIWEGHLHLNGVLTANEGWAHQLFASLKPGWGGHLHGGGDRLLMLGQTAVKLLAIGLIHATARQDDLSLPFEIFDVLDEMYSAEGRTADLRLRPALATQFQHACRNLDLRIADRSHGGDIGPIAWLFSLLEPGRISLRKSLQEQRPGGDKPGIRKYISLLNHLHFKVLHYLILCEHPGASPQSAHDRRKSALRQPAKVRLRHFIHEAYYRYIIYQTHHWQCATQSGKTTGLRNFVQYFQSPFRGRLIDSEEAYGLAFERLAHSKPLKDIEGRLSPQGSYWGYLPWLLAYAFHASRGNVNRFGFVIHFNKDFPEPSFTRGRTKSMGFHHLRFGNIRRRTRNQAWRLFRLLSEPNEIVPFIVGIDAASLELKSSPEVFAPAFRFLREYPIEVKYRPTAKQLVGPPWEFLSSLNERRLGLTYHIGEDFRHILSGLRAIDEVLQFLRPVPGDRLGHAIALGLNPDLWLAQIGNQALMPRLEWLDTLVWVHHLLGPGHDLIGELAIEDRIQRLSRDVYGRAWIFGETSEKISLDIDWTIPALFDSWMLRQLDPYSVDLKELLRNKRIRMRKSLGHGIEHNRWWDVQSKVLREVDKYVGSNAAYQLLGLYWFSERVADAGGKLLAIPMGRERQKWIAVFREVQEKMKQRVRDFQLVIEVNPSSNRVIGPLDSFSDHHIFPLTLDKKRRLKKDLRVTINSDDPGVFATSLAHEYYLLGEILVEGGIKETDMLEWLEWLRRNGEDCSFIRHLPLPERAPHLKELFDYLLTRYAPLLRKLRGQKARYKPELEAIIYRPKSPRPPSH